ncbi:unnamed protein product [Rotaria magnacalcarata]|uniref:Uncharacterized protein n=3 Tax=Rotaria magnacalcarata TaxID=392030 RepID=A0A815C0C7_9BILA|nr:unnamed protein product [Rotaria magnacalcarata]CAF2061784.1 unnamed protein product [Rotaria magnacalcarata]CAF3867565.1 unnamed protein product [Rotaria magnacalcarata]
MPILSVHARWLQNGTSVAGGHEYGGASNQLAYIGGFVVDDDGTVVIADICNNRIMQWKVGDMNGKVVAGGNGGGSRMDQLTHPGRVLIEQETNSLIICDYGNKRIVRWSLRNGITQGEVLLSNTCCSGLAMDDQRYLYVSNCAKHEVRRYQIGDKYGTRVAGGNDNGTGLNQLNIPLSVVVDRQQTVYVSDYGNYRVMKWNKNATEGIVVAGGQGNGTALTQLSGPTGLFVDTLGYRLCCRYAQ